MTAMTHEIPVIMSAEEVVELLQVDRKTVYLAAQRGHIPHHRLGRRQLFERGAVLSWLRQGCLAE
ncbi:helix-turn-helix domain-containing protein [Nannocystaceae bacterium ST9]